MYHVSLTHFSVLLYSFCASVWILYITLSSNSLILSFTISSLIFIYRVLNFTLSYVRISLVKLSVSSIFLNVFTFPNVYVWWLQHLDHLSVKYCGNNLRVFLRSYWGEFSFFFCGVESDYKQITLFHSWNEMFQKWVFIFTKACQQIHVSVTESLCSTRETNPALLINFIQCKAKKHF